jgi:hypothetical protein
LPPQGDVSGHLTGAAGEGLDSFGCRVVVVRERLSYANVMATIAVFLALGGGAYAAIDLVGRNDIKSKHIAKNAVKGKDVAEGSLAQVPEAASAVTAANADSAANAAKVNGLSVVKIDGRQDIDAPEETILDLAGLRLRMSCAGPGGEIKVYATTSKPDSSLYGLAQYTGFDGTFLDSFDYEGGDFDTGEVVDLDTELDDLGSPRIGSLVYEAPDGSGVNVNFASDINGTSECLFTGTAVGG